MLIGPLKDLQAPGVGPERRRVFVLQLSRIEADLRASERLDLEHQQEAQFLRQQGNRLMRTHLCYLSLSQRVAKYDLIVTSPQNKTPSLA